MNKLFLIPLLLGVILLSGCSSDAIYIFAGANNISGTDTYILNVSNNPYKDWWIAFPDFTVKVNTTRAEGLYINWSYILNAPNMTNYTPSINDLNNTKLDKTDQRYNNTALIQGVNTSSNIESLGFNTTTKLKTYFDTLYLTSFTEVDPIASPRIDNLNLTKLNITDQRYNDTARIDDLNLTKGNASTGNCSGTTVVQNVTTMGVQCITPTASVDLSAYSNTSTDLLQDLSYRYDRKAPGDRTEFYSVTAVYNTPWVLGAIASGTGPLIAGEPNHPGIVQFTSSTSASSGYTYNIAGATSYRLAGNETTQTVFRPYTKINNGTFGTNGTNIKFGFMDVFTGADAVDGVYFNLTQNGSVFTVQLVGSNNSLRITNESSTTLTANTTWYVMQITINNVTAVSGIGEATGVIYNMVGTEVLSLKSYRVPNVAGRETSQQVSCIVNGAIATTAVKLCDIDYLGIGYINNPYR